MAKTLDEAGVKRLIQEIKGANKNLNTPIPISLENTPESMAQNVKNIADYVEKAKAAGIDTTKSFRLTLEIDGYPVEGSYDIQYSYAYGLLITDDGFALFYDIDVTTGEVFPPCEIVTARSMQKVTSSMLDKGARNPIILTSSTTKVDEETYQKLLSDDDDVDVILKIFDIGNICTLTSKIVTDQSLKLYFSCLSFQGEIMNECYIFGYLMTITKISPHTCSITENINGSLDDFLNDSGYLNKSTLTPVLQEIDLTGTDADRKAKLDQFETDWKALTGADDLTGARFVGKFGITDDIERIVTGIMTYCAGDEPTEKNDNHFYGICNGYSFSEQKSQIAVKVSCKDGSLTITLLFSHLEAITIYTDNTPEHMQANLDNIAAYEANLQALGVDTTKSPMIPCGFQNDSRGWITKSSTATTGDGAYLYTGIARDENGTPYTYFVSIKPTGKYSKFDAITSGYINNDSELGVVGVQANAKSLEAITIKTGNAPKDKAANVAAIKAYVDNLKALGVDVTKGYMIPVKLYNGYHGFIMGTGADGEHTGVIKRSIYTSSGGGIRIDNIGTYTFLEFLTVGSYDNLTTTAKTIVPAINEVNALAKGYSTIFTPIELTTETAQNKTAIDARVAAFTAQGISLTNGCCIPVTYKGVYAGNISLINGDWYGLLVKNTNNPADNINIKLSADGTITEGNSAQ